MFVVTSLHIARRRFSASELRAHAREHSFELAEHVVGEVDLGRMFVCETVTPLYYCAVYRELPEGARRRYNQLVGLFTNEIVTFFESSFANAVLTALARGRYRPLGREMADELLRFAAEERKHVDLWRRLNRAAAPPGWYREGADYHVLKAPPGVRGAIRFLTRRPVMFPVVLWLMLLQEERSIDISRRCVRAREELEPHFVAAYRAHLEEEVRHVQIDWHLIEHYYAGRSAALRRTTAALLRFFVDQFLLVPRRSTIRTIDLLLAEFGELGELRARIIEEVRGLGQNRAFQEMMYSRQTTPIAFSLFDRFEEFRGIGEVMKGYRPMAGVEAAA
jgi:hypothetical protein